jgi:ATP-dependent DNA helicase RecG
MASPVTSLKGVGDAVAAKLKKLRIETVEDLIDYVPFRFDDFSKITTVNRIKPGPVTLKVTLGTPKGRYSRKGLHMTECLASDSTGSVKLVWFNQPYRANSIKTGQEYFVSGEFASNYKYFAITNPACELVSSFPVNTARLVPIYRLTKGLGATQVRKAVKSALEIYNPSETLPRWLIEQEDLMPRADALREMHFPVSVDTLNSAKRRLGFEEVFELTLASELNRESYRREHGLHISFSEELIKKFVGTLDFALTDDQRVVAWQIFQDMASGQPMNRLVEGDVGSGKTVVAVLAAINAMNAGCQVAFLAPTEILANQHAESIHKLLMSVNRETHLLLLTGSMSKNKKDIARQAISDGSAKLVVGTHAIFQDTVTFKKLGLVIVDEQHRFGVEQRKKLLSKGDEHPHVLSMTATPIPRSLALTLYGEMNVSVIKQMPPGRKPVYTQIYNTEARKIVYEKASKELSDGRQAFVVCPQIEEDEAGRLSVKKIFAELEKKWRGTHRVGLLHGRMNADEKDAVMLQFNAKEIDVLVSTTVVEVGVNVPNATVMIIEGADKFGLAQLHQLRGRVGRGGDKSYCYLILSSNDEPTQRLQLLASETNGFKLAEYDLELRGPGAIYGNMQSGALDLRVAKLTDIELIQSARTAAKQFIKKEDNLLKYPQLHTRVTHLRKITNLN